MMTTDEKWKPCEPGMIQEVAEQELRQERQATMTRRALFSVVLAVGAGVAYSVIPRGERSAVALTCSKTLQIAESYVRGELSKEDTALVDAHLEKCQKCMGYVEDLREQLNA